MDARYLLARNYQLRGWLFNPYSLVNTESHRIDDLAVEEFDALVRCDGAHDIPEDDTGADIFARFLHKGVIEAVGAGARGGHSSAGAGSSSTEPPASMLAPGQEYHLYPCWRFRSINWAVTGRCNFNCRHCFAAKDVHPTVDEPSLEQCLGFVDQMHDCGVDHVWITGGEPLVRADILDITSALAEKGILLEKFGTNASLLTGEFLDKLEAQGHHPQFNVSFDGVGHHDWMRGTAGAEEQTLAGIRLLKERGFGVKVQSCVCKENLGALRETTETLAGMGVDELRVIRVVESTRWMETSPEQTLPVEDHYQAMLEFADWYLSEGISMQLDIWGVFQLHSEPAGAWCRIVPVHNVTPRKEARQPICGDARQLPFVGSDGRISLCNQISGYMKSAGIDWGNVYETPLASLLGDSGFTEQLLCTWGRIREHNPGCMECRWRELCNCGCRAVALATAGDILGKDPSQCAFFEGGYHDAFKTLAEGYGLHMMMDGPM